MVIEGTPQSQPFWERPDVVEQFASRDPDHRLVRLVDYYHDPASTRVLDLGCAGGRNTIYLAQHGFDVWAMDASAAMVERTRDRLRLLLRPETAEMRVRQGRMEDLSEFADGWFDLVVALGVYHNARTRAEWKRAIAESARVLKPGGRLLVNSFTPAVDLTGKGVHAVAGERDVFEGLPDGRAVLVEAPALDAAMAQHGLIPEVPSETVSVATDNGRRVSVNALYVLRGRLT